MVKAAGNWAIFLATALLVFTIASSKHVKHLKRHNAQVQYYGKSHRKADVPGSKRQLWQFKGMIECATGRSTFDFVNYGSYCGWGGSGIAVDELDRCCKVHDECYGEWDECRPKTNIYAYQLAGKHPNCQITCGPAPKKNTECERAICLCDKVAAECFARSHYNPKHKAPLFNLF